MIAQLFADQVSTGLCVTPNARIMGSRSGVLRQIDVLIESRHTPDILRRSIVEAKRIERKIHVKDVETLLGMMDDVDARHGYLVCPTGHSDAALRRAQDSVRICLIPLDRIADFDPTAWPECLGPCKGGRIFWDGFPQVEMKAVMAGDPLGRIRLLAYPQRVGKCEVCGAFHVHCLSCRDTLIVPHVPRERHLAAGDMGELVEYLHADRAAVRQHGFGPRRLPFVTGGEIDQETGVGEAIGYSPRPGRT